MLFAAAIGFGLWLRRRCRSPIQPACRWMPKNLAALSPPIGADAVVAQDQPGDAGEKYAAAGAMYLNDPDRTMIMPRSPTAPRRRRCSW